MADENLNKQVPVEENGIEKDDSIVTNYNNGESSDLSSATPEDGEEVKGDCYCFPC